MHNAQEPSYYEIALTNRQVLGFFVVLLLCVVGAFFSGIWLGRKQSNDLPIMARAGASVEREATEEEPLEELNFFTDSDQAEATTPEPVRTPPTSARQEVASPGDVGTTLAEDLDAADRSRRPEPDSSAVERVSNSVPSEPASSPSASASVPDPGGLVIQVFSSPDGAQARKLRDRLIAGGYDAFVLTETVGGRTMHRVRIGPFAQRRDAETLAAQVAKAYKVDTWITRNE